MVQTITLSVVFFYNWVGPENICRPRMPKISPVLLLESPEQIREVEHSIDHDEEHSRNNATSGQSMSIFPPGKTTKC